MGIISGFKPSFCIKSCEMLSNRESIINQNEKNLIIKEFNQTNNIKFDYN